ncbi:MAG: NUDIX hydrolase [Anaerolineales bacterium]|nr:NUDIX hydrolase [Anaerolineales bacterium]
MDYETIESESVFQGRIFDVQIDRVRTPDGSVMRVDVVAHNGAVAIIAIDARDNFLLVRQYRHPAGRVLLELPAGTLHPGEEPQACARRESREEIGLEPGELIHLGGAFMAPGYSTEFIHFFLARDLKSAPLPQDPDEDIELVRVPRAEMQACVATGQIEDVKTIAGISLAEAYLAG